MSNYKLHQRKLQTKRLLYDLPELFNNDTGGASFGNYKSLIFVLQDGKNNLFNEITEDAVAYFKENDIAWWGDNEFYPPGHILSSQIQCLNYLFALRKDKDMVLRLAQLFNANISDILPINQDKDGGYIAFEFTYNNAELLNEKEANAKRGKYCTSIDAFMIGMCNDEKILIPIEWKYTESYPNSDNKAKEPGKGQTRQERYNQLIESSKQLKTPKQFENCLYYHEPFYEIARQTLLAEQIVKSGMADDFLHVLIIPEANSELLYNSHQCENSGLEKLWNNQLLNPEKFKVVDGRDILSLIKKNPNYKNLYNYLNARYN
ncbi:PGN_0703 family putative restriction endonuclease [Saccharicrinis aurantiacus]|uniref:PGN_0703 family putative restriction endonuclease n=1 Tax=Saccharicrinis aurantiacus TaxID=1849719 RepID=UPI002493AB94|nr:hypothetical protein [Saccharicrinis aurantiacus]